MEQTSSSQLTYEMKKERFLTETLQAEKSKSTHLYVLTRDQYSDLISQIEEAQRTVSKNHVQQRRLKRFEVSVDSEGGKRLILKSSKQEQNLRYFLPIEEIYDVIDNIHRTLNHAGRDKLMAETALNYANITREMVVLYLSMCETCVQKKLKINKAHMTDNNITSEYETLVNSRCQVDIIDFQKKADGKYKFIMVYQDHMSKFTLLRALETDTAPEIANNLIDIFLTIGAPCIIQSNNRKAILDDIIHNATIIWPELVILNGKIQNPIGALENINHMIENSINRWLVGNKSTKWSEGLRFVQFTRNTTYNLEIKRSPFKAMFGVPPKIGLGTIPQPPELINAIKAGKPFNTIQPQIMDYTSIDHAKSSSGSSTSLRSSVIAASNIEAIAIKEEVSDGNFENCVLTADNEPKYVNLYDLKVDVEDSTVRALKRTIDGSQNSVASTRCCETSNVLAEERKMKENLELPVKQLKVENIECVRSEGTIQQEAQPRAMVLPPRAYLQTDQTVNSCSCATNCVCVNN